MGAEGSKPALRPRPAEVEAAEAEVSERSTSSENCLPPEAPQSLADYFLGGYLEGAPYEGTAYEPCYDEERRLPLLLHGQSGVRVWREALDLRAAAPGSPPRLVFHYLARPGFVDVASGVRAPAEALKALATAAGDFGAGLLTSAADPEAFGYKDEVLLNNFWPRAGDPGQEGSAELEGSLLRPGESEAGPGDPASQRVVDAVLENPAYAGSADFCIPVLVPQRFAFDIWQQLPPDLAGRVGVGCNRWGEKQWRGRDICVVQLSEEGRARLAQAGFEGGLETLRRRVDRLEGSGAGGRAEALAALADLAALLQRAGRHGEAEAKLRRALAGGEATLGEEHCATLAVRRCLGRLLAEQGRVGEAEPLLRRVAEGYDATLGAGHPEALAARRSLATLLCSAGNRWEACQLLREGLQHAEAVPGGSRGNIELLEAKKSLAILLQVDGRHGEAEPLLRQAVGHAEAAWGPAASGTLQLSFDLAMLQKAMGDHQQAVLTLRRALAVCEAQLGPEHADTLSCLTELAIVLQARGETVEAEKLLRRVLAGREAALGLGHPDTLTALDNVTAFLKATGRRPEAASLLRQVLERWGGPPEAKSPAAAASVEDLAALLPQAAAREEPEPEGMPFTDRFGEPDQLMKVEAAGFGGTDCVAAAPQLCKVSDVADPGIIQRRLGPPCSMPLGRE